MSYKAVDPVVNGSTAILLDESDGFLGYQDRDGEIKPVLANVGLFANNLITDAGGSGFLGVVDPITGKEHWMQNEKDGSKVSFKGPQGASGPIGYPGLTICGEFSEHPKEALPQVPSKNVNDAYVLTKTWDTTQGFRRGDVWVFDEKGTAYYKFNCEGPQGEKGIQGEKGSHYINAYYPDQRFEDTPSDVVAQYNHKPGDFSISTDTKTIWVYDGNGFISGPSIRGSRLLSYTEKYTVEDILDGPNHANIQREIVSMTDARLGDWIIIYDGSVLKMGETLLSDTGLKMKGADGQDGIDGKDGVDGLTPYIGINGNWFIGEEDTSVKARGPQGEQGQDGRNIFVLDDESRDSLANIIGCSKSELLNLLINNINSGNESIVASIKELMKDAGLNWNDYLIIDNWVFLRYLVNKPDDYDYTGRELVKNGELGPGFRLLSEDEIESLARLIGLHRDSVLSTLLANANGVNPDESIMSGLPEFYSDLGMDNLDIFVFDGYSFQCQKYTEDGQVSLYTYSRISGEDGVDGVNGNTPQLKVEDGFWKVSYDNGDSWEQIAEYVGKSDLNTISQELSQVGLNVRTLSALTQRHESNLTDINNLLFQGGNWFEDMEELSPEVTGFDKEYSDIPHYIMYHNNILLKDINYESGELLEEESYPLYGEHEGYTDPAQITYNLYGDYCTVSVSNLLLISGWADIYFRLPVEPVEETNTTFMAGEGSDYQLVCCTVGHHDYSATGITEPVLWFRTCDTDTYHTDYHISLTITYKYRNNEDF